MVEASVCAVLHKDREFLLVKRKYDPFKNRWALPSGSIDEYELAELAVKRAVKEETSLDFKPIFLNYYNEIFRSERWHSIIIAFSGEFKGPTNPGINVSEINWFSYEEINRMHLASVHKEIIEEFIKNEKHRNNNKLN